MRKRGSGVIEIEIRDKRLDGGRLAVSARTTSRPEARRREAALRGLLDAGEYDVIRRLRTREVRLEDVQRAWETGTVDALRPAPAASDLQLGPATDRLLQTVKATRAPKTLHQYEIIVGMLLERFGRDRALASISSDDLETWLHEPKQTTGGKPWSGNRQKLAGAIVGRLFNVVIRKEEGHAARTGGEPRVWYNPLKDVETPPTQATRVEFLREEEWLKLLAKVRGHPYAAFLALGCLAGLRIGETAHLRTGIDLIIDGADPRILIQPREGEFPWVPKGWPRSTRSARTIRLRRIPTLLELLHEHAREGYAGERYFIRTEGRDRPVDDDTLGRWTKRAFLAAGIRYGRKMEALTYHSLRHSFISWLVQADYSLKKIEKLAGTSVKMINDVYGHLVDEDLDQGMALIESRLAVGAKSPPVSGVSSGKIDPADENLSTGAPDNA